MKRTAMCFALCVLSFALPVLGTSHFPTPQGYVTDTANIMDTVTRSTLEQQLTDFDKKMSMQIAVVTVPSLEGEILENYASDLFKRWGIGQKGQDNGILVLIARDDHKIRMEVGYGLESKLTDGTAGDIIRNQMTPSFRTGRYSEGISLGVEAVMNALSESGPPVSTTPPAAGRPVSFRGLGSLLFFGIGIVALLPGTFFSGVGAFLIYHYYSSFLGCFFLPFGILLDMRRRRAGWGRSGYGGWMGGGGFGSGGFGGGGGFGGFGGGSSGGGGASGGW